MNSEGLSAEYRQLLCLGASAVTGRKEVLKMSQSVDRLDSLIEVVSYSGGIVMGIVTSRSMFLSALRDLAASIKCLKICRCALMCQLV